MVKLLTKLSRLSSPMENELPLIRLHVWVVNSNGLGERLQFQAGIRYQIIYWKQQNRSFSLVPPVRQWTVLKLRVQVWFHIYFDGVMGFGQSLQTTYISICNLYLHGTAVWLRLGKITGEGRLGHVTACRPGGAKSLAQKHCGRVHFPSVRRNSYLDHMSTEEINIWPQNVWVWWCSSFLTYFWWLCRKSYFLY